MSGPTRYARRGGVHIAYQATGTGDSDLVLISSWFSHVEYRWEYDPFARWLNRLGAFSRLLSFDKRGMGLSDPVPLGALPTLEEWMDDVTAVMDAAGSSRAAVMGVGEGGMMAMLYAATHPERVSALVLSNSLATVGPRAGYPWGVPALVIDPESAGELWGTGVLADVVGPSLVADDGFRQWWQRFERHTASPGTLEAMLAMILDIDLRPVLPSIRVPTLVLHSQGNLLIPVEHGRFLGSAVAGARYVELPGRDYVVFGEDMDASVGEIEEFLTGARSGGLADRVLATMLFTDIVDSTGRAALLGDRRWRELLDAHDGALRRQIDRYRGRELGTAGDGFLVAFDGPARAILAARAMGAAARGLGLELRAGIHTGEVEVRGKELGGIAVHIAARISAMALGDEILVSRTVKDLVAGSDITFAERGRHHLKGVPETWEVYRVEPA